MITQATRAVLSAGLRAGSFVARLRPALSLRAYRITAVAPTTSKRRR
jgi:hypothetical protein